MTEKNAFEKLEECTKNAQRYQLEALRSILLRNGSVRYLQNFIRKGEGLPLDPSTFKRLVPLSSYDHYVHFINQMAEGNQDPLLCVDPLCCFFYSTGTTSSTMKPKLIPYFDSSLARADTSIAGQIMEAMLQRLFPPRPEVNKVLWFLYSNMATTKCGLKVMAASTYALQLGIATPQQIAAISSPFEVIFGSHVENQLYCHLICGLRNLDILDGMAAPYAIGLIKAFGFLESKWEQLCDDLCRGFPSDEISEVRMREAVTNTLGGPQPELAERIRSICEGKNWCGIVHRLWPNIRYIKCVTTGSMKQYYQKLKYYAGDVPILGGDYWSSECAVGINLDIMQPPENTQYLILPTSSYFEFLPFSMSEEEDIDVGKETVDLVNVEVGKMYEVVVTTCRGFYRYRMGDVVRVAGFHNSCPLVEFVTRAPKSPGEILTEKELISAVENFQLALRGAMTRPFEIVEFASFLDQKSWPKLLKVFVEVQGESNVVGHKVDELVTTFRRCISSFENSLGAIYKVQKEKGVVGNLVILVIRPGTFDQIQALAIKNGASAGQYKPPKIIRNHEAVELMEKQAFVTVSLDG